MFLCVLTKSCVGHDGGKEAWDVMGDEVRGVLLEGVGGILNLDVTIGSWIQCRARESGREEQCVQPWNCHQGHRGRPGGGPCSPQEP